MKKYYLQKLIPLTALAVLLGVLFQPFPCRASTLSDEEIQALIKRVNELEQQVKALQQEREAEKQKSEQKAEQKAEKKEETSKDLKKLKEQPTVSLGLNGLQVRSADSNFTMIAHGYVQTDGRFYLGEKTTPDTFLLRRVRPIVEGTVWKDINYRLMLDLGSGNVASSTPNNNNILDDAYVNARYFKQAQIQVGKYKSPIGLERLQSTADLFFVETGFATELVPNYDLGASIHNDFFNQPLGYSIGIYNGAADNASQDADVDEGKDVVGRLFAQPFLKDAGNPLQQLGFGVAGSVGTHDAGPITSYRTPGQQVFYTYTNVTPSGMQYRIDPQAYYFFGPFGIMGEYVISSQKFSTAKTGMPPLERFNNRAWQVQASYFLTGETNSFKYTSLQHVVPNSRFGLGQGSGWGAFEVVARVQQMLLDPASFERFGGNSFVTAGSAQKATAWGVGINWYLNSNLKLNLNYEQTTFSGYTPTRHAASSQPEHVILSRIQFMF